MQQLNRPVALVARRPVALLPRELAELAEPVALVAMLLVVRLMPAVGSVKAAMETVALVRAVLVAMQSVRPLAV